MVEITLPAGGPVDRAAFAEAVEEVGFEMRSLELKPAQPEKPVR